MTSKGAGSSGSAGGASQAPVVSRPAQVTGPAAVLAAFNAAILGGIVLKHPEVLLWFEGARKAYLAVAACLTLASTPLSLSIA